MRLCKPTHRQIRKPSILQTMHERIVRQAVDTLPENYRSSLLVFYFQEMDLAQAANPALTGRHVERRVSPEPVTCFVPSYPGYVMHAVRTEAQAPEPIPFPWIRALPGIVACLIMLLALTIDLFLGKATWSVSLPIAAIVASWHTGLNWVTLSFLISAVAMLVTRRCLRAGH